jgi:hypothetical protein
MLCRSGSSPHRCPFGRRPGSSPPLKPTIAVGQLLTQSRPMRGESVHDRQHGETRGGGRKADHQSKIYRGREGLENLCHRSPPPPSAPLCTSTCPRGTLIEGGDDEGAERRCGVSAFGWRPPPTSAWRLWRHQRQQRGWEDPRSKGGGAQCGAFVTLAAAALAFR